MDSAVTLEAKRTLALQQIALTLQRILAELSALRMLQQKQSFGKSSD
jgi:hypothetical protein